MGDAAHRLPMTNDQLATALLGKLDAGLDNSNSLIVATERIAAALECMMDFAMKSHDAMVKDMEEQRAMMEKAGERTN